MIVELVTEGMTIHLASLIEKGKSPIDIFVPDFICNLVGDNPITGIMSSYPVLKNDEFFDFNLEFKPMRRSFHGSTQDYFCFISDLIIPMGKKLKDIYENMTEDMRTLHLFDYLWVESLLVDTKNKTLRMELGS